MMEGQLLGEILQKLVNVEKQISKIEDQLESHYVTRKEFDPVKNIVYATAALILIGFFGVLTALVYGRSTQTPLYNPQVVQSPGNLK